MKCAACGSETTVNYGNANAVLCSNCISSDQGKQAMDTTPPQTGGSASHLELSTTYRSEYETARKISMFISALGWVAFPFGIIAAFIGLASATDSRYGGGIALIALLPGLGIAISGLFLVAAGQVTRATVDNADHTREILRIVKNKA